MIISFNAWYLVGTHCEFMDLNNKLYELCEYRDIKILYFLL